MVERTQNHLDINSTNPAQHAPIRSRTCYRTVWTAVNLLLIIAIAVAICSTFWEYSTRRYLRGFSDAIVPATVSDEEKVEAILHWLARGPERIRSDGLPNSIDPLPSDTLNYDALLRVCGSITNAFINLANTAHLKVRRLLLVDPHGGTKHVVVEVLVDGQWIVVDPSYHIVFRDLNGKALNRTELIDAATFAVAISRVHGFDPSNTFNSAIHIRRDRIRFLGPSVGFVLDRVFHGWDESTVATLLVERESFAAMLAGIVVLIFVVLIRLSIRWYAERKLGIEPVRFRQRLWGACAAFFSLDDRNDDCPREKTFRLG